MRKRILGLALAALFAAAVPVTVSAADNVNWPLGQALPHFGAPADTLDAIGVVDMPLAERLAISCLQGIVNRAQPRIFLVDRDHDTRDYWGDALGLDYDFLPWKDVLLKHLDEIEGLVVFNPAIRDTNNVACTVAGILDALAVSPALAEELSAAPYHLPVLEDLREAPITDKLSAYRWLHENYWGLCTRRTISGLAPDGHFPLRDFSVAVKAAIMWLDPGVPEERAVMKLFFDDTAPIDTYYTGWWPSEGDGISFASSYGVMTIPSDFYLNYTVYSGMSREIAVPAIPAKPALENDKIYVSLLLSDGDNIQYCQGFFRGNRVWGDPRRGEVPIGYTFAPVLLDAGPQLLDYYHRTSTPNDVLVSGPSGVGYSTAADWPDRAFAEKYGVISNSYFERAGFNFITVWSQMTARRAGWYAGSFPSLLGMTVQFVTLDRWDPKIRFTGSVPVVWLGSDLKSSTGAMSYDQGTGNMKERLSAAAEAGQSRAQFYIAQGSAWDTTVSDLAQLAQELNEAYPGRFVFVRPDHFMLLVNEAHGKPFRASLQKQATASSGDGASRAFDGTFSTGWQAAVPGEASLTVDLGGEFLLDRYVLKNASTNYLSAALNTGAWKLQVSGDGERWRTIDSVRDNAAGIVYRNLKGQCGRYVRLVVEAPGADNIARVQELEMYGTARDMGNRAYGYAYSIWNRITGCVFNFVDDFKRIFGL